MAASGSLSHRIELEGRDDEFRELADGFDAMLARLEAHVAEQRRFAANASHELRTPLAITQALLDVARNDPNRDVGELRRAPPRRQRPGDRPHRGTAAAEPRRPAVLHPEQVDLSLVAEEATEALLPLAEKHGVTIETSGDVTPTIGSPALLLQMTTNLLQNAIVHNLPEHGTVRVDTAIRRGSAVLTVENTGDTLTSPDGLDAHRAVPAGHRARTHRPRWCRPRPGDRQEHHPGARRNAHHRPPPRRRALRHGAPLHAEPAGPTTRSVDEQRRFEPLGRRESRSSGLQSRRSGTGACADACAVRPAGSRARDEFASRRPSNLGRRSHSRQRRPTLEEDTPCESS